MLLLLKDLLVTWLRRQLGRGLWVPGGLNSELTPAPKGMQKGLCKDL